MIRFAIAVLAVIGVVSLFLGGVSGAAAGAGFLLLLPLFLLGEDPVLRRAVWLH